MRSLAMRARSFSSPTGAPSGSSYVKPASFVPMRRMPCRSRCHRRRTPAFPGMSAVFCENRTMTAGEKLAAWLIGVFAGLSRLFALSKTPWDSDEGRFMSALRHYDVTVHHPHPPGFPLFIAFAKAFSFLGEFRALQVVSLIAAIAIVPAAIFCGRALRFSMRVTLIGAAFLAFFPNVWYFGGTAFSDVPSMTLSLIAIALLLRGQWVAGAIVVGVAAGFRPQAVLIVAIPAVIGIPFKKLVAFAIIVATIVIASYGAAAHFSGGWPRHPPGPGRAGGRRVGGEGRIRGGRHHL